MIGEGNASRTHFVVGGKVRKAIKDIGGAMPEDLPPQEHIEEVKKRLGTTGDSKKLVRDVSQSQKEYAQGKVLKSFKDLM